MRIYVASSWRNTYQPAVVEVLRHAGHLVYDFRNPEHGQGGFQWSDIDPQWEDWSTVRYRDLLLNSPVAAHGYLTDFRAMQWADACLMVLPCGRSASMELGWSAGAGKRTGILLAEAEPELMALMADELFCSIDEVIASWRT